MKKALISAMAMMTAFGAAAPAFADPGGHGWRHENREWRGGHGDRDWDRGGHRDRYHEGRGWDRDRRWDHNYSERRGWDRGHDWGRHHRWSRGDRLPYGYWDHYRGVDYRYHGLRAPPRGCRYVVDDRGDILLVGLATGLILGVFASHY